MTIRHMRIFLEVYRMENITQAAKNLHMTQPAVTRAVQEIERHYGVLLFDRMNRRLFVTEAGRQFYAQALHIVESFDRMEKGLLNGDAFGVLRIGASISLGNFFLPGLVSAFRKNWPDMKVKVTISNAGNLQSGLLNNELDLALIEGGISEAELETRAFSEDRMVLILPVGHELAAREKVFVEDLKGYDFLAREKGSVGRTLLDHVFAVRGITLEPLWESASTQAIIKGVQEGIGVSILPEMLVEREISEGRICSREVEDEGFRRVHYVVWHRNKFLTEGAVGFIEMAVERGRRKGDGERGAGEGEAGHSRPARGSEWLS